MKTLLATALLAAALAFPAHAEPGDAIQVPVKDFDIYVDPPTGFVFVKLPQAWKFVGKVDAQALTRLPPHVLTALLRYEEPPVDMAKGK